MKLIDGKQVASNLLKEIQEEVLTLPTKPLIAFILVGNHPASITYVRAKKKACLLTGIDSKVIELPNSTSEGELLDLIDALNQDSQVTGILVQLPLPSSIDESKITNAIQPTKDIDGFHPLNLGKTLIGDDSAILPCTPQGIHVLLEKYQIPVEGKHVVIVGRSNIVGKPLAAILMQKKKNCNATVTICHSRSKNLSEITKSADILVAAIGSAHFINKEMIKANAVVVDVGINRVNGKIVGDVHFEEVAPLCSYITPVPGGVGPMTIAMLLKNTLKCYSIPLRLNDSNDHI